MGAILLSLLTFFSTSLAGCSHCAFVIAFT